eukprot:391951_1
MQPLIRLQLLASQLTPHELRQLVVESYTADQILSFIFNHFRFKYHQTKKHDNNVSHMIQSISDILDARKSSSNNETLAKIKIDSIPSDMIGECASFLSLSDYVSFSKCNRKTYIGCNSPPTLQAFDLSNIPIARACDLSRFPLLKQLKLSYHAFVPYIELNPNQNPLDSVHSLTLYDRIPCYFQKTSSITSISKCVRIQNIRRLTCSQFGIDKVTWRHNSKSFCDFVSNFSQVNALCLRECFLTDDLDIESVNILPQLRTLYISKFVNDVVRRLRNKWLDLYSKQLLAIIYEESKMDINVCCFPKLKAIRVSDPNADTLLKIINNAPLLEQFNVRIPMVGGRAFNKKKFKKIIDSLFDKCIHLQIVGIKAKYVELQHVMKWMEHALRGTKKKITKHPTLRVDFVISSDVGTKQINEIMVSLRKLIKALESATEDFMLMVYFPSWSPRVFDREMDEYEKQYLVCIRNDFHTMIISNKTCKIDGYNSKHIFSY